MIRRFVLAALVALCACGQTPGAEREAAEAAITVTQTQEEVVQYLREISEREPVAEGVRQHVRDNGAEAVVTADLMDIDSGNVIGVATYTLTPAGEQTRIALRLSQMTGAYADAVSQEVLRNRIMGMLRRDLGDV